MKRSLAKALDDCLTRISNGETIADCLADYPDLSEELMPLLDTAVFVNSSPKVSASVEFRKASYRRLIAQISPQLVPSIKTSPLSKPFIAQGERCSVWGKMVDAIAGAKKLALAAMIICLVIFVSTFLLYGPIRIFSTDPVLANPCTLTILSGTAVSRSPDSEVWMETADGIVLEAGSRIKTDSDSHAILTFFDGSTIKLEPNTDITIEKVEQTGDGAPVIVLNQWLGKTWSRVIEMTLPGSQYEIHTPSAAALVRGTMFTTEVEESGLTKVKTTEGTVSVVAQDHAVDVSAGLETIVDSGVTPSEPVVVAPPESILIFSIDMPAIGSVRNPLGASTGYMPDGLAFNQIPDSQSSMPGDGTQIIAIPQPVAGDYLLILRAVADELVDFSIKGESGGQTVFETAETQEMANGGTLVVHLNVNTVDGYIENITVFDIVPLQDNTPEKIVKIEPIVTQGQPENDKGKDEDKVKESNAGGNSGEKDKTKNKNNDKGKSNKKDEEIDQNEAIDTDHTTANEGDVKGGNEEIKQDDDSSGNDEGDKKDTYKDESKNNKYKDKNKYSDKDNEEGGDNNDDDEEVDEDGNGRNWWQNWKWWRN